MAISTHRALGKLLYWLVENNRPLREFETPAFREMIRFANPMAEAALWTSQNSVSRFVMRLYSWL